MELDQNALKKAIECYSEGGCSGLSKEEIHDVVTDIIVTYNTEKQLTDEELALALHLVVNGNLLSDYIKLEDALIKIIDRSNNGELGTSKVIDMRRIAQDALDDLDKEDDDDENS